MLAASTGSPEHVEAAYSVGAAAILGCSVLVTSQWKCGGEPARGGWASADVHTLPSCAASEPLNWHSLLHSKGNIAELTRQT